MTGGNLGLPLTYLTIVLRYAPIKFLDPLIGFIAYLR
jgi:hypothetical protein